MKIIPAFETPDKQRFFNEDEARQHERRYDFGNQIDTAVRSDPQFARLDRDLLIAYFMKHGKTIGKLAEAAILPERPFGAQDRQDAAERIHGASFAQQRAEGMEPKKPTTGILPHPMSPEGQRRLAESEKRAKEILTGDSAMDAMADELERELNKSA